MTDAKQQWKRAEQKAKRERLELTVLRGIHGSGLPEPEREYLFARGIGRKWRFDFAWPDRMLALEVEGGQWSHGRHNRGSGLEKDAEKYNQATLLGWRVLRVTTSMVEDNRALELIEAVFREESK